MYKLAHLNWIKNAEEILITNDLGRFFFLSHNEFDRLLHGTLEQETELFADLMAAGFVYLNKEQYALENTEQMACMKQCLLVGTQLLILVLTDACNQRCIYCQAGNVHTSLTAIETCRKAIDMAVQSPVSQMTIEFQGGEPTLNPNALRFSIPYAKRVFEEHGKKVDFAIVTNLTNCDQELMKWLISEDVHISTSLDGHRTLHDVNRPLALPQSSYDAWVNGVRIYKDLCAEANKSQCVSAIQTTTRHSLPYPREIVDEYIQNGMDHLYIRPLTPLGCAKERWNEIGYTPKEYLDFYCELLDYMIAKCIEGQFVYEATATLYLTRILANDSVGHTEFRSPCGAAIGQMAVNYDGFVYTCDEGRMIANMGDPIFRLGSVDNTYQELMRSPVAHAVCAASCIEALPFCSECVYSPYCAVCPVVNYGTEGDLISHDEYSYRCVIARGIIDHLFSIIRRGNPEEMEVLDRWIHD